MRIKLNSARQPLWRETPCTMPYVTRNMAIDRSPRFHINSIYHKDDVHKPKKVFTDFEKPQLLVLNFRRQIQQAGNMKHKISRMTESASSRFNFKQKVNPQMVSTVTSKLYQVPEKLQYKHDQYGNRSNLCGDYDIKQILSKNLEKRSFTSGRRTDLSRPLNFYPGPGTYFSDKPLSVSTRCKNTTCVSFNKIDKQQNHPKTQRKTKDNSNNKQ